MKFQKLTRGGHEYVIYKIYTEDESIGSYVIHGASRSRDGYWVIRSWLPNGRASMGTELAVDLLPEKKRRFKTNEELINSGYSEVLFKPGVIIVQVGASAVNATGYLRRYTADPTGDLDRREEWLEVFTTVEEDSI